jgi:hypothetical protein
MIISNRVSRSILAVCCTFPSSTLPHVEPANKTGGLVGGSIVLRAHVSFDKRRLVEKILKWSVHAYLSWNAPTNTNLLIPGFFADFIGYYRIFPVKSSVSNYIDGNSQNWKPAKQFSLTSDWIEADAGPGTPGRFGGLEFWHCWNVGKNLLVVAGAWMMRRGTPLGWT